MKLNEIRSGFAALLYKNTSSGRQSSQKSDLGAMAPEGRAVARAASEERRNVPAADRERAAEVVGSAPHKGRRSPAKEGIERSLKRPLGLASGALRRGQPPKALADVLRQRGGEDGIEDLSRGGVGVVAGPPQYEQRRGRKAGSRAPDATVPSSEGS